MCMKGVGKWKGNRQVDMAHEDGRNDEGSSGLLCSRERERESAHVGGGVEYRGVDVVLDRKEDRITSW